MAKKKSFFMRFANMTAKATGKPAAFILAAATILVWGVTGPLFGYSDTWQLVINTGTTIVTFLMVFLIQNTQNRDTHALQLKLDELIKVIDAASNEVLDAEDFDDKDLEKRQKEMIALANEAKKSRKAAEKKKPEDKS